MHTPMRAWHVHVYMCTRYKWGGARLQENELERPLRLAPLDLAAHESLDEGGGELVLAELLLQSQPRALAPAAHVRVDRGRVPPEHPHPLRLVACGVTPSM